MTEPAHRAVTDELLENNRRFASRFEGVHLDVRPSLHLAIVTCMDSRLDVFAALGLEEGQAHVLRNAGGVITDDVIRSLAISQRRLGTDQVILIHHTDCGLELITDDGFRAELQDATGMAPPFAARVVHGRRERCSPVDQACPPLTVPAAQGRGAGVRLRRRYGLAQGDRGLRSSARATRRLRVAARWCDTPRVLRIVTVVVVLAFVAALVGVGLVVAGLVIPISAKGSFGMAPALPACDGRELAETMTYWFRQPRRGDIVAIHSRDLTGANVTPDSSESPADLDAADHRRSRRQDLRLPRPRPRRRQGSRLDPHASVSCSPPRQRPVLRPRRQPQRLAGQPRLRPRSAQGDLRQGRDRLLASEPARPRRLRQARVLAGLRLRAALKPVGSRQEGRRQASATARLSAQLGCVGMSPGRSATSLEQEGGL